METMQVGTSRIAFLLATICFVASNAYGQVCTPTTVALNWSALEGRILLNDTAYFAATSKTAEPGKDFALWELEAQFIPNTVPVFLGSQLRVFGLDSLNRPAVDIFISQGESALYTLYASTAFDGLCIFTKFVVQTRPILTLDNLPREGITGSPVVFSASAIADTWADQTTPTIEWDYGDGTSGEGNQVVHTYPGPGVYQVEVKAFDGFFHSVPQTHDIEITDFTDADGDGVADIFDNCTLHVNQNQRDTDADGFGNVCDADLNNDRIINFVDLGLFKQVFFSANMDADFNGDGAVNAIDLATLRQLFGLGPGPSAVALLPPRAPTIRIIADDNIGDLALDFDGKFSVQWTFVIDGDTYNILRERTLDGEILEFNGLQTFELAQSVFVPGRYEYSVQACKNFIGCGSFSQPAAVVVDIF